MTSPASGSDAPPARSSAFARLHEKVQRWIWERGWTELRDLQEAAVEPILAGTVDVILSAATASGKTEAAFFPICTRLLSSTGPGVRALYVSPLKALINDQWRRLDDLCERLEIPVHRWHGDVASSRKQALVKDPSGLLLITPESLEALFVVHGSRIGRLFESLQFVVVDELHAFIGAERGRQLQALLHRLEVALGRRVPRVALSATLGDMSLAAEFLRPGRADSVHLIRAAGGAAELKLQVRGYVTRSTALEPEGSDRGGAIAEDIDPIADHLFKTLRGSDNLVFANARRDVELYADLLARRSERERVPNEFFAHHGSLSKEFREDVEARLKKEVPGPVTAICTSTLEMGIDIGSVKSVAQIGAPFSVASTRQRLGRSGRRSGEAAILRVYIREEEVTDRTPPQEGIREELVQTVAVLSLLLRGWCEPPAYGALHLSTLVQQVLSSIAQRGGVSALDTYRVLCESGPFRGTSKATFAGLLRSLGAARLIAQGGDGAILLLGEVGERIVNHYSFYTAFQTPEEYRLVSAGHDLGTLPIDEPLIEGTFLIFAGRRWRIVSVDVERKVVDVAPAPGGRVPRFGGSGGIVHDAIRREMLAIYTSFEVPAFLDATARELLVEGRTNFARLGLTERALIACGSDALLFPWSGDRVMSTLAVELAAAGLEVVKAGVALSFTGVGPDRVRSALEALVRRGPSDAATLARAVENKAVEKYDRYLSEALLCASYASSRLDPEGAVRVATEVLRESHEPARLSRR